MPRKTVVRWRALGAVVLVAPLFVIAAPAHAAGTPTCLGREATIVGTPGPDRIPGTEGDDVIVGLTGRDIIDGLGGNDLICGNGGVDTLNGGAGDDVLDGGLDKDFITGEDGNDVLIGRLGPDVLNFGDSEDGDDVVFGVRPRVGRWRWTSDDREIPRLDGAG